MHGIVLLSECRRRNYADPSRIGKLELKLEHPQREFGVRVRLKCYYE